MTATVTAVEVIMTTTTIIMASQARVPRVVDITTVRVPRVDIPRVPRVTTIMMDTVMEATETLATAMATVAEATTTTTMASQARDPRVDITTVRVPRVDIPRVPRADMDTVMDMMMDTAMITQVMMGTTVLYDGQCNKQERFVDYSLNDLSYHPSLFTACSPNPHDLFVCV
jgi:hypothetical protein